MNKKLLIWTIAAGRYKVYTELFKYCIRKAYPEYDVDVLELDPAIKIVKVPPVNCTLINKDTPFSNLKTVTGFEQQYTSACLRFVLKPGCRDYDYVYITDIDMMICPEDVSILDFHKREMFETWLPYSNTPRWKEPMGENRLTGLHFVGKDWWEATEEQRYIEFTRLADGLIGDCKCEDELMLMRIVKNSKIRVDNKRHLVSRHHGIHLGTIRDNTAKTIQEKKMALYSRVSKEKARWWLGLMKDREYNYITDKMKSDPLARYEISELEKYVRQISK
jgi:hypothetical protein